MSEKSKKSSFVMLKGKRTSPAEFLHKLGARRFTSKKALEREADRQMDGQDDAIQCLKDGDYFSNPVFYNSQFRTEEMGLISISEDFDRLVECMHDFDDVPGFPLEPKSIADLGGCSGHIGMWLALKHPTALVTIYDCAEMPLKIGAEWAKKLGITNVVFEKADYKSIARSNKRNADLVIAYYAFNDGDGAKEIADAIQGLLIPTGIAVVQTRWEYKIVQYFLEETRILGLGVDWKFTYATGKENCPSVENAHLFLRRGAPAINNTASEDTQAFFASAEFHRRPIRITGLCGESFAELFIGGKEWLTLICEHDHGTSTLKIITKAGLLIVLESGDGRITGGFIQSSGILMECVMHKAMDMRSTVEEYPSVKVKACISIDLSSALVAAVAYDSRINEVRDILASFK